MAELRALAAKIRLAEPATFIASGNLLFSATDAAEALERTIEDALRRRFGFDVPVLVRDAGDWTRYLSANPFVQASAVRPNLVMLALSKRPLSVDAAETIAARAGPGEHVAASAGALWFDYGEGVAGSRLTPAFIDRAAGSPVTGRNWRSVLKLGELLGCE